MKELRLELNTKDGKQEYQTTKINGVLKNIILKNKDRISVNIKSEYGYLIYNELDHQGVHYFSLKSTPLNRNAHKLNFVADDFHLNERILITIEGPKNTDILIILRYCEFGGEDIEYKYLHKI